ncbi:PAAR domain-containing protein [Paraburkholderia sediminicola]|uniref:PAAR domain-containing protein n=1 Tax=Paraburkholderia sediminicola TaxID=458836 RepID=UPI0038B7D834
MRIPIVRHGDSTTTRGKVVAFSATIHGEGRKIALPGDQATCGNCKGLWHII